MNDGERIVWFTVTSYYPSRGGVQEIVKYEAEGLVKKGYKVNVLTTKGDDLPETETHNGVNIHRTQLSGIRNILHASLSLTQKYATVIVVCPDNTFNTKIVKEIEAFDCKKIAYFHGMHFPKFSINILDDVLIFLKKIKWVVYYNWLFKKISNYSYIVHLHELDEGYLFCKKKYPHNTVVIHNFIDDNEFNQVNDSFLNIKKDNEILYIANFCRHKNQKRLLNIYYKYIQKDIILILIGSKRNKYYDECIALNKELERKYGEKNVKIIAGISRNEIIELYYRAKVFVMTSRHEFFPVVFLECMRSKLPFISSDVGVARYLPGGVIAKTDEDFSYWIQKILNFDYYAKLGELGYEYYCNECSGKLMVDILAKLIN